MTRADCGVALLEAVVALAILALAGTAAAELAAASLRAEVEARARERELAEAGRLLAAMTLLDARELDRRIGHHPAGAFVVGVQRPAAALYRIAVAVTDASDVELLVTVVYRPEPSR